MKITVETGNTAVDEYFKGNITLINNLLMSLAEEQIKTAFDQAEKEVNDLHTRISEGMRESKRNGTKIGLEKGTKLITKKSLQCKEIIKKYSKEFDEIPETKERKKYIPPMTHPWKIEYFKKQIKNAHTNHVYA